MKKNSKIFRTLVLSVLCLSMALSFCACGGKKEPGSTDNPGGKQDNSAQETPEFVYVPEYTKVKGDFTSSLRDSVFVSDGAISSSYEKIGVKDHEGKTEEYEGQYDIYGTVLYKVGFDGSCEKLGYTPMEVEVDESKNMESYTSINGMTAGEDGNLYLLEVVGKYWVDAPEGVDENSDQYWDYYQNEQKYYLRCLKADGTMGETIDLDELGKDQDYFYPYGFEVDKDGNILVAGESAIYVLDASGALLGTIPCDSWIERLIVLSDGRVCALNYGESNYQLSVVDVEKRAFGENIELKGRNMYDVYPGGGDYDLYYNNGSNFFGYKISTGESTKILNWINCDIDSDNIGSISVLDDGRIAFIDAEWDSEYTSCENSICLVSKKPYDSVPHKEAITLATIYLDYDIKGQIIKFNRNNDKYRIEVKDYSEYNTDDDYTQGLTKLTTEIMAGNVPDIIDLSSVSLDQLASKGILEDLYPYIDSDSELDRSDFFSSVLTGLEKDGKLYTTVSSFNVQTVMGATSVVGDKIGWTVDQFKAALATMPEGCTAFDQYTTKADILSTCMSLDMDNYVNWNTGECNFTSEGFIEMLEFANSFPSEFDWDNYEYSDGDDTPSRIAAGRQMLVATSMGDFQNYLMYEAMFGGEATFIGYPTAFGNGNMLSVNSGYGICANSKYKDEAWQFLRMFFTEDYQSNNRYFWGFPSNINAFNKSLKAAMTPNYRKDANGNYILDENGNKIEESQGSWGWGSITVEMKALTQAQADKIVELINSTTKVSKSDEGITSIVSEQAQAYFDGQKSAEDVAKLVQSKVNIYVNEQR